MLHIKSRKKKKEKEKEKKGKKKEEKKRREGWKSENGQQCLDREGLHKVS